WGRGKLGAFQQGWSGSHGRRLRGDRLYLAVDCDSGHVITFVLARGRMRDHRLAVLLARRAGVKEPTRWSAARTMRWASVRRSASGIIAGHPEPTSPQPEVSQLTTSAGPPDRR